MTHRWVRLTTLVCLVCSITLLGSSHAQTPPGKLQPRTQTVGGAAFGAGTRMGIVAVPDGIAPSSGTGTAETAVTAAPAPFTYLMLRWRATASEHDLVHFEVRVSEDGQTWTDWGEAHENEDLIDPTDDPEVHWSSTIYAGLSKFWQLRVTLNAAPDGSVPVLHEVQVNTVDSRGQEGVTQPARLSPAAAVSRPAFVPRESWGGSEVLNNSVGATWYPANHLILHHTADQNALRTNERTWADRVRAEWAFHTYPPPAGRGWGDVGYNWLVDPNGVIYEGRNGSSSLDRDSVGFHDTGNKGSMGVVMLGTFGSGVTGVTPIVPTQAAQDGVVRLFAWKASQRGIDPLGRSFYYGCSISTYCAPYNPGSIVANIAGHRQVTPRTTCPGDLAMGVIDSIRTRVRDTIGAPPGGGGTPVETIKAELTNVQYSGSPVEADGVVQVQFTVRNTGTVAIESQEPLPGSPDNPASGYVYDEAECFIGNTALSYPAFPKETGRVRVVLGGSEGGTVLGADCAGNSGGYPWRWGIGGSLQPGESRTVVGYVRFRNPTANTRNITLQPAIVSEYVQYFPSTIGASTISVTPERRAPELSTPDETGMPLASVYRLAAVPDSLLERSLEAASVKEGELLGTFAWDGSEQAWATGGPAGQTDRFVITQVRPIVAPQAGVYTFELTTDEGSWLWIDGQPVVENHGLHTATSVSGSTWLSAGVHVLAVKYFENTGTAYARYSWIPPGATTFSTIPVPGSAAAPWNSTGLGGSQQTVLVADDLGGLGVSAIQYSVDGGPEETQAGGVLTLSLSAGHHWVVYRAIDNGGARSPDRRVLIWAGGTPPSMKQRMFLPIVQQP